MKQGCKKDICYNQYCKNNVYGKSLFEFSNFSLARVDLQKFVNDKDLLTYIVELIKTKDTTNLICSDTKSITKDNVDTLADTEIAEAFEDVYQFSCSFVDKTQQKEGSDPIRWSSIDLPTYYKFLKRVNTVLKTDELINKLGDMLEIFELNLETNATIDYTQSAIRGFILLLLIPEMEDYGFYEIFERTVHLFKICLVKARHPSAVTQLKSFPKEFLTHLVPKDEFFKTVSKFQQYITIVIIENVFKQEVIMSVIEVLDMFE